MTAQENINNILTKLAATAQTLKECEVSTLEEIKRIERLKKDKEGLIAQINEMHKELEYQTQIVEDLEANRKKFIQTLEVEESAMMNKIQSIKAMAEQWAIPTVAKVQAAKKGKEKLEEESKMAAPEIEVPKTTLFDTMSSETLADKLQGERRLKRETTTAKSDLTVGAPISNIAKAISLNDQMLFTKEIFKDDYEAFVQTVKQLNDMDGFDSAQSYIESSIPHWESDNETAQLFLSVVRRRYL